MFKKTLFILILLVVIVSCGKKTSLSEKFNCNASFLSNLEIVEDVKNNFSIKLPKTWKTNLYFDDLQSSIYTADTTKQLTKSLLLDFSYIKKDIEFNTLFKLQQEQEGLAKKLILKDFQKTLFLGKESCYTISKGKKEKYPYLLFNLFIKENTSNFVFVKTEIYGDSLVNERICEAINIIEKIKFNNDY